MADFSEMTVFNLSRYTAHQVFLRVREHLLAQGQKSLRSPDQDDCQYLTDTGLQCAVGVLIPRDKYTPKVEGKLWYAVEPDRLMPATAYACGILGAERVFAPLLRTLQRIHDISNVSQWQEELDVLEKRVLRGDFGTDCHDPQSYAKQDR